jgi:hypothetical protein
MTSLICPAYLTVKSPDSLIGLCGTALAAEDSVMLDARALRFADPFGLALLGATFYMLQQRGQTVRVAGLTDAVGGYLQRMDVFEGVELVDCALPRGQRHDRTDALVELTRLDQRSQIDRAANQLAEALVGLMPDIDPNEPCDEMSCVNTADRITIPISYALTELLNNAMSHARLKGHGDACVWVASQYYRSNGRLQLAVVDNGCGMLKTLREHAALRDLPRKTDLDAILAALRPRVSCNRDLGIINDSTNQGIGLTTTARIAEHAGGRLVIVSGAGCHDPLGQSRRMANSARWQGVAVALECQRDALLNVRIRELMPPIEGMPPLHLRFEE